MEEITIYTDGACSGNPGPGGWGAILMMGNVRKEISGGSENTTNNIMELSAVIEALKLLKRPCKVNVFSDSAYVVNAFNQKWFKTWVVNDFKTKDGNDVKNKELWLKLLYNLDVLDFLGIRVSFIKVKGHNGDHFNELADKLARKQIINNK